MRISVIGTGYLGATHAACLAHDGHDVVGVDTDPVRVARLSTGRAPFHEPELDTLLRHGLDAGRLRFTTTAEDAAGAQVHFLTVGTPQSVDSGAADLSCLWTAVETLAPLLREPCLVLGKSTVPAGTARVLARRLRDLAPAGDAVRLGWNPEFLREGYAVADTLLPDRIVLGLERQADASALVVRRVYARALSAGVPLVVTDLETAELAKVSANAMLATRISTVNVLAEVCEAVGADITGLTRILGLDERIGPHVLRSGLGYGGSCLPKDTRAFVARAEQLGLHDRVGLLREVDAVNLHQRQRTVERAVALLGGSVPGSRVAVLGAAFKAGSDDVRDSPALCVATALHDLGAEVVVHDPRAEDNVRVLFPSLKVEGSVDAACAGADVVLVLTEWPEFGEIDPVALGAVVRRRRVLDARLVLDPAHWRAAGWRVEQLGRASDVPVGPAA